MGSRKRQEARAPTTPRGNTVRQTPLPSKLCQNTFPCFSQQVHGDFWGQPQETRTASHRARTTNHRLSQGCESRAGGREALAGVREGCEVHHKEMGSIGDQGTDRWTLRTKRPCGPAYQEPVPMLQGSRRGAVMGSGLERGTLSAVCGENSRKRMQDSKETQGTPCHPHKPSWGPEDRKHRLPGALGTQSLYSFL